MGTTLTGTTPQDTYDSLIKVTDNGPISGTAKYLSDGLGTDSALALSTTAVGVGTATPASALHVLGTQFRIEANDPTITLKRNVATAFGGHIDWLTNDNTLGFQIANNTLISAAFLEFNHSGVNRMVIKSDGNVGIGTSAPTEHLQVEGSGDQAIAIYSTTTGVIDTAKTFIKLFGENTAGDKIEQVRLASATGTTASSAGQFIVSTNSIGLAMTERMRLDENGFLRLSVNSSGIQFNGDTAAANALDDYEEGTWTMGVTFGGASVGLTTSINTGNYTKIGRQVTISGQIALSNKGSSTGIAQITGLPFAVANNAANFAAPSFRTELISNTGIIQGYTNIATTLIPLEQVSVLGAATAITNADFSNSTTIIVSATYFV